MARYREDYYVDNIIAMILLGFLLSELLNLLHCFYRITSKNIRMMKANKLTPNFEVSDVKQTVDFYSKYLGFKLIMAVPEGQDGIDESFSEEKEYVYAMVQKDYVEIFFQRSDSFKDDVVFSQGLSIGASVSFYMDIEGIKELHEDLKAKNLQITELKTTWYGMQEFYLKDIKGYILGFSEKAE